MLDPANFDNAEQLHSHYDSLYERLRYKQPWHEPKIKMIWWKPTFKPVFLRGLCAPPSLHEIFAVTLGNFDISLDQIRGRLQPKNFVRARQQICYLALANTNYAADYIGKLLNRDHATVIYGAREHAKRMGVPYPRLQVPRHLFNPYRGSRGRFTSRDFSLA